MGGLLPVANYHELDEEDQVKVQIAMGRPVTAMHGFWKMVFVCFEAWSLVGHTYKMKIFYACQFGLTDHVKKWIQNGADVDTYCKLTGDSCLTKASENGHTDIVEMLIDAGADINRINNNGNPVLVDACRAGKWDIAKILIENGADVYAGDRCNETALHHAVKNIEITIPQMLIDAGAEVNALCDRNMTPLCNAIRKNIDNRNIIELLIDNGAWVEKVEEQDLSPLEEAARWRNTMAVEILLKHGAVAKNSRALVIAVSEGNIDIMKMLLDAGADKNEKYGNHPDDPDVYSAVELAEFTIRARGFKDMKELLDKY